MKLEFKSINGCGKIATHNHVLLNTENCRNTTYQFLKNTLEQFVKVSTCIFKNTYDMPFWYSEKQLSSIFLPAFYNIGYAAMQEIPTRRKPHGEDDSHAWLDYWVQKDDKLVYLIEVKHGWIYFDSDSISCENSAKLEQSIKQLKQIRKNNQKLLSGDLPVVKISIMVIPVWKNVFDENLEIDDEYYTTPQKLNDLLKDILKSIDKKIIPNWVGVWSLPKNMQFVYKPIKANQKRVIPGVFIFAKIV